MSSSWSAGRSLAVLRQQHANPSGWIHYSDLLCSSYSLLKCSKVFGQRCSKERESEREESETRWTGCGDVRGRDVRRGHGVRGHTEADIRSLVSGCSHSGPLLHSVFPACWQTALIYSYWPFSVQKQSTTDSYGSPARAVVCLRSEKSFAGCLVLRVWFIFEGMMHWRVAFCL